MNLHEFRRLLRLVVLLPLLALAAIAIALFSQIQHANRTVDLIREADQAISETRRAQTLIANEESGLRGYETTADPRFLEPYTQAQEELPSVLEGLERLPGEDEHQRDAVRDLREAHQNWEDGFATLVIASVRNGAEPRSSALNMPGKMLMDGMREDLEDIVRRAEDRRAMEIARWHSEVWWTLLGLFAGMLGVGLLIGQFARNGLHAVSVAYQSSLEELNGRAEALFRSEQQMRTTLHSIADGVVTCDREGKVRIMNPVAEEITGWSEADAAGRAVEEVFPSTEEGTGAPAEAPALAALRDRGPVSPEGQRVLVGRHGRETSLNTSGAPILDKSGALVGAVMVFRDVTRERATQRILMNNEKLATAGKLAATIAHEIHNPLDAVSNCLYLLRTAASTEEATQYLALAEGELARATSISRAMLRLYRESTSPIPIDLGTLLDEILLLMERQLTEAGVSAVKELGGEVGVRGFPAELRQVFTNLITNAVEAAGTGGVVRVTLSREDACLRGREDSDAAKPCAAVRIADNGAGIPEEAMPFLFQEFFTTKGERGTGLGLWVSRGIIAKHGGTLHLTTDRSPAGHGTVATVVLPLDTGNMGESVG